MLSRPAELLEIGSARFLSFVRLRQATMIITMMKKMMIAIRITPTGTAMAIASVLVGRPVWAGRREWWWSGGRGGGSGGGVVGGEE